MSPCTAKINALRSKTIGNKFVNLYPQNKTSH